MALMRDSLTDGQIGRRLGISEATVGKHLEHTYRRLGMHSRIEAVERCRVQLDLDQP